MAATPNPCDASFFSQVFAGNAIVCSKTFQQYEVQTEKDAIQSVADNAKAVYGDNSAVAQVAQTTATQQEAQATEDVTNVADAVANSKAGQIFTTCDSGDAGLAIPGLPCVSFKWIALGIGGLVVLYVLALVSSVIPRPR